MVRQSKQKLKNRVVVVQHFFMVFVVFIFMIFMGFLAAIFGTFFIREAGTGVLGPRKDEVLPGGGVLPEDGDGVLPEGRCSSGRTKMRSTSPRPPPLPLATRLRNRQ